MSYTQLINQYKGLITGAIHIGCKRDDYRAYSTNGVERIIYVEPDATVFARLFKDYGKNKKIKLLNCSIGAPKPVEEKKPDKKSKAKKVFSLSDIASAVEVVAEANTIDTLHFQRSKYNLLKISDVESIDFVLGGASKTLKSIEYIYLCISPGDFYTVFSENILDGFYKHRTIEQEDGKTIIWLSRNAEEPPMPIFEPEQKVAEVEQLHEAAEEKLVETSEKNITDIITHGETAEFISGEPLVDAANNESTEHGHAVVEELTPESEVPVVSYPVFNEVPEEEDDFSDFTKAEMPFFKFEDDVNYIFRDETTQPFAIPRKIVLVPEKFCNWKGSENENDFEQWYFKNLKEGELITRKRYYLPIFWNMYYRQNDCTRFYEPYKELQDFLNSIDRSKKYYTICQYPKGILNNLHGLDIKVFSAAPDKYNDFLLPMLRQPHVYPLNNIRDVFCSFLGNNKNIIRDFLFLEFKKYSNYYVFHHDNNAAGYCYFISRSLFTFCPPGDGELTHRITEALQYGSIPVIITDKELNPCGVPFTEYGVVIKPNQLEHMKGILESIRPEEVEQKQKRCVEVYQQYYTFQSAKKIIFSNL